MSTAPCADIGRLQQVTSNLLGNALTHGCPRSPVRLTVRNEAEELVLEVWNDGEPIPEEFIGKIFEPFWRHSTSGSRHGLGLGLYICSQIIRAHLGELTVASTREGGTLFTARLPLRTSRTTMAAREGCEMDAAAGHESRHREPVAAQLQAEC